MAFKYNEIQNIIDEPPPPYSITINNYNNSNNLNNSNNDYNLCCNLCYNCLDYINKKIRNCTYDFCMRLDCLDCNTTNVGTFVLLGKTQCVLRNTS